MRVLSALFVVALSTPALAAGSNIVRQAPLPSQGDNCRRTTSYLAERSGLYRGYRLTPKKLTQLPPATTYMAVFRHIGGCEAPLTMIEYRRVRQR